MRARNCTAKCTQPLRIPVLSFSARSSLLSARSWTSQGFAIRGSSSVDLDHVAPRLRCTRLQSSGCTDALAACHRAAGVTGARRLACSRAHDSSKSARRPMKPTLTAGRAAPAGYLAMHSLYVLTACAAGSNGMWLALSSEFAALRRELANASVGPCIPPCTKPGQHWLVNFNRAAFRCYSRALRATRACGWHCLYGQQANAGPTRRHQRPCAEPNTQLVSELAHIPCCLLCDLSRGLRACERGGFDGQRKVPVAGSAKLALCAAGPCTCSAHSHFALSFALTRPSRVTLCCGPYPQCEILKFYRVCLCWVRLLRRGARIWCCAAGCDALSVTHLGRSDTRPQQPPENPPPSR